MNRLVLRLAATALCAYSVADVPHVRGGLLHADFNGPGTAVTFLSVTLAYVILRLGVAREIIGFLNVTDTYIHTYILFPRCDAELVASR